MASHYAILKMCFLFLFFQKYSFAEYLKFLVEVMMASFLWKLQGLLGVCESVFRLGPKWSFFDEQILVDLKSG